MCAWGDVGLKNNEMASFTVYKPTVLHYGPKALHFSDLLSLKTTFHYKFWSKVPKGLQWTNLVGQVHNYINKLRESLFTLFMLAKQNGVGGLFLSNEGVALIYGGEIRADSKGKVLHLLVCLWSSHHLWSWLKEWRSSSSNWNELPLKGDQARP